MRHFTLLTAVLLLSTSALATEAIPTFNQVASRLNMQQQENCKREEVRISMQSNYQGLTVEDALKDYEENKRQFAALAKKMGIEFHVTGENYNFNVNDRYGRNNDPSLYNMNGTVNYVITTKDKAKEFYQALGKAQIRANMNYSMNDNCHKQR